MHIFGGKVATKRYKEGKKFRKRNERRRIFTRLQHFNQQLLFLKPILFFSLYLSLQHTLSLSHYYSFFLSLEKKTHFILSLFSSVVAYDYRSGSTNHLASNGSLIFPWLLLLRRLLLLLPPNYASILTVKTSSLKDLRKVGDYVPVT